jgi:putative endonuclease
MDTKIKIGKFGQDLSAEFLQKRGYKIIGQNFFTRLGELDLIAEKDKQIIFIEVKTRLGHNFGLPEEALNSDKAKKIREAALEYLVQKNINNENYRYDLVAVEINEAEKKAQIRHYKNVI